MRYEILEDYVGNGELEDFLDVRMKDFVDSLEMEEIKLRLELEELPQNEDITVREFIEGRW